MLLDKLAVARCIEEGRPLPAALARKVAYRPELAEFYRAQRRMAGELARVWGDGSEGRPVGLMVRAPRGLRGRTVAALHETARERAVVSWWLGPAVAAATVLLAMGVMALVSGRATEAPGPIAERGTDDGTPVGPALADGGSAVAGLRASVLTDLFRDPGEVAISSFEERLRSEADALAKDARQMAKVVLARFPSMPGGFR